jgi:hypothetical protein
MVQGRSSANAVNGIDGDVLDHMLQIACAQQAGGFDGCPSMRGTNADDDLERV